MVSLLTYISEIIHTKDTFDHKLWRLERDLGPTHSAPQFWEDAREDDIMCILVLGTTADYMLTRYFFLTLTVRPGTLLLSQPSYVIYLVP